MKMKHSAQVPVAFVILAALAATLAPSPAHAQSETDAMHSRAHGGQPATKEDREHAKRLLEEWRESERVSPEPGDQALGRALESIAGGRGLSAAELAAFDRYAATRRADRLAAAGQSPDGAPGAGRPVGSAGAPSGRRRWILAVAGAGAGVFGVGVAWILAVRRFRRG